MVSLSSVTIQKHWRYSIDEEFRAILPGGEQVSRYPHIVDLVMADETATHQGDPATWASGSPHDSASSALKLFVPFNKPLDTWTEYSVNSDDTLLAIASGRRGDGSSGHVTLVDITSEDGDAKGTTTAAVPNSKSQTYFGRLSSAFFGARGSSDIRDPSEQRSGSRIRTIKGFVGAIGSLVFSPSDPIVLVIASVPDLRRPNDGVKENIIIWDTSSNDGKIDTLPDVILESAASNALEAINKELARSHNGVTHQLKIPHEEREALQESIVQSLHRIDMLSWTDHLPKVAGRLMTSFGSNPFSHDGTKLLYMPGPRPDSNGRDERWKVCVYDLLSRTTTHTLEGHLDAIMWAGFSQSGKWIMTICWDKTVRLWDSTTGQVKWVWRTKQQNWTGLFSPDETYVIASCGDGTIIAWSIATGEELWRYKKEPSRWMRQVAFSPDGKYLAFGSDGAGSVSIIDLEAEMGEERKVKVTTYRALGADGVERPTDYDNDDDDDQGPEKQTPEQKEKQWEQIVKSMIATRDVQFLQQSETALQPTGPRYCLGYMNSVDRGLEVYDLGKNEKWRVQPVTDNRLPSPPGRDEDDGKVNSAAKQAVAGSNVQNATKDASKDNARSLGGERFPEVLDGLIGWKHLHKRGEVMTIHGDGVRFWREP